MERAGTGLIDACQLMTECGGNSAFFHHSRDARFEALVTQPQASAGSRSVARSDVPTGVYILNALPFTVLPATLSIIQLTTSWREPPRRIDFSQFGPFVLRGSDLWDFVPRPTPPHLHGPNRVPEAH